MANTNFFKAFEGLTSDGSQANIRCMEETTAEGKVVKIEEINQPNYSMFAKLIIMTDDNRRFEDIFNLGEDKQKSMDYLTAHIKQLCKCVGIESKKEEWGSAELNSAINAVIKKGVKVKFRQSKSTGGNNLNITYICGVDEHIDF